MTAIENKYVPDYAIHPGEYLGEVLESRDIKKQDFAKRIGLTSKAVSQIINGKSLYSPEVSLMLEKTLGISANIWMNLLDSYQLFAAREKDKSYLDTDKTKKWLSRFPVSELKKNGVLPQTNNTGILADSLLRFFNIANPEAWEGYYKSKSIYYRKSERFGESKESTAIWLRLAEREAEKIETSAFDKESFKSALEEARRLSILSFDEYYPKITEIYRKAGVAAVVVPELHDTHISGAACWLSPTKAMIAVSLRYKTNDHFWFTFYHEAAHILLHGKKNIFIDLKESGESVEEKQANELACDTLIPKDQYSKFIQNERFYENDIRSFAKTINIHPGIVAGRLQHDGTIPHSWYNSLKEKIGFSVEKTQKK